MGFVSDIVGDRKTNKYKEQFKALGVSTRFFYHKHPVDCIQLDDMALKVTSKEGLRRKVCVSLYYREKPDFYDFSLIMGLFFDTFNIYSYQGLTEDMKKELISLDLNSKTTRNFLNEYSSSLIDYFQKTYDINADFYQKEVDKMFTVVDDESLYGNVVCNDLGKILIASYLTMASFDNRWSKNDIASRISSGQMIEEFDRLNGKFKESSNILK